MRTNLKYFYSPEKIYIQQEIKDHWLTKRIIDHYNNVPHLIINSSKEIEDKIAASDDPVGEGKKYLYLCRNQGQFVKKCPGTSGFICCNYYVIDLIENCPVECSYCFLQNYLTEKMIKIYVNVEDLFMELDDLLKESTGFYRIGTGELADSLALDEATGFSSLLINYFSKKDNALIELKTKTNQISHLLNIDDKGDSIISWSINPNAIIELEEHKSSSLEERLAAAYQCQEQGYQLAFHFDPIIYYENWQPDYAEVIKQLFHRINSNRIAYISLGGFRYNKPMAKIIANRFRDSRILYQELLESPDGKHRYFIKIRQEIYKTMLKMFKAHDADLFIYLCMEGKYMWKKIYGFSPQHDYRLDRLFRQRLIQIQHLQLGMGKK